MFILTETLRTMFAIYVPLRYVLDTYVAIELHAFMSPRRKKSVNECPF